MVKFSAEILGVEVLNRAFNRVEEHISDFRQVFRGVPNVFYAIEAKQFGTQGGSGASGKWAALSPAYAKYKAKAFPGMPILQATTSLVDAMTSPDAPDSIFRMDANELVLGTQREGATAHQRGSGKMPARPIISFTEEDKRQITKAIQAELVQFTRRLGFQVDERAAA